MAADTQLVDCVGVRKLDQLNLVQHHFESVQNAILRCHDLALFVTVSVDHFAVESILTGNDYLVFASWIKSLWVHFPKLFQQSFVRPQDNQLVVNVRGYCNSYITEVLAWIEKEAVSSQIGEKITVQLVVLQLNSLSQLAEGFFSFGPLKSVCV